MAQTTDVVVIGGGIAGASVAYELAAELSVVLVEAESVLGAHSTGRSAAALLPGAGSSVIRALTEASEPRFRTLPVEFGVSDALRSRAVLWTATDDAGEAALHAQLELYRGGATGISAISSSTALELCPRLRPETLRMAALGHGADIDAAGVHDGYLRGLRRRGGDVLRGSPVTGLRRGAGHWHVSTPTGHWHAGRIVDAAGAWADTVADLAGVPTVDVRALRRTIAISPVPVTGGPVTDWPFVFDAAGRYYFRPEGNHILCSPCDEQPVAPGTPRPDDVDIALVLERVNAATTLNLRSVHRSWSGLRAFAAGGDPVVGAWPEEPTFSFVAGQGGYGIEIAPALAAFAASVILERPVPADIPLKPDALLPHRRSSQLS